jgi:hypothetical protein
MRLKLLLFTLLYTAGLLNAQEPYRSLVISEARQGERREGYFQITNRGNQTINLSEFEVGKLEPATQRVRIDDEVAPLEYWFNVADVRKMRLPNKELAPGETYIIASVSDWLRGMFYIDPFTYTSRHNQLEMRELADYAMYYPEGGSPSDPVKDSIDPKFDVTQARNGRDAWYIIHHYAEDQWAVIDQVYGVFDGANGQMTLDDSGKPIAGVAHASREHTVIRKANITEGNIDFNTGRGVSAEDSEWMIIPPKPNYRMFRPVYWTVGTDGPFVLSESTLTPRAGSGVTVDYNNGIINVPWGVQRDDSVMFQFVKTPGVAWNYSYVGNHADSAYLSARTGDSLTVWVFGNNRQEKRFRIEVAQPAADANIVIPLRTKNYTLNIYTNVYIQNARFRVSAGNVVDTIYHSNNVSGVDFATRADTLIKYLEKAPGASWEFIWEDGVERVDLKHGDILRVTAESGAQKDYFIRMDDYRNSRNANLASITWPDIPDFYRGILGWRGDTIPGFDPQRLDYTITVPADVDGFPALVAKPANNNANISVNRAASLFGPLENRTVTFVVTAEDGTVREYKVTLEKEQMPENIQPYSAQPFISQRVYGDNWGNDLLELTNPGNQPIDLSHYMFYNGSATNPATAIETVDPWAHRYRKFIPGRKWTSSEAEYEVSGQVAQLDGVIDPILHPGRQFVFGDIKANATGLYANWWVPERLNVRFRPDPWGEGYTGDSPSWSNAWAAQQIMVFRIINDSVRLGLKPPYDPEDFELIETWGHGGAGPMQPIEGITIAQLHSYTRKPEFTIPKAGFKESFGDAETSEWILHNRAWAQQQGYTWPLDPLMITANIGRHTFIPPTYYMSTVSSLTYKVSEGFSENEEIRGIVTGTTVAQLYANLDKADPGQTLTVLSGTNELADEVALTDGDILVVVSADETNTTRYVLEVTDEGLSSDAVLTSNIYTIEVDGANGTIGGFEYGALLKAVRDGVTVPSGALLTIIDQNNAYVSTKKLNFDTIYVDTRVSDQIFFEVIAEDGETKIVYQLIPDSDPSDAFITSDVYLVDLDLFTVSLVPSNTTVTTLMKNVTPSRGATIKVVDKIGNERTRGTLYKDDRILVTAQDGETTNIYHLTFLGSVADYLAFLTSVKYAVNQITFTIVVEEFGVPTIGAVLAEIQPSAGATIVVTDAQGNEKADTELIADGDRLIVTAANGITVTNYTVQLIITSIKEPVVGIRLYPNPSTGTVYLEGLEPGAMIQVYNIVGVPVITRTAQHVNEILSMESQPAGLYFVVISNGKEITGRHRLIIR